MLTAVALSHVIAAGFASPSLLAARPSPTAAARAPILIAMGAKKSRYADDGTREAGINIVDDESLAKGFFSNFKWGTEVDVGPAKEKGAKKKGAKFGDGAGSDRGLGGNQAYRNTESARLSDGIESQRIRKERLEAYINSDEAPADPLFGKIIAGSLILVLITLLGGVGAYYGIDGLLAIGNGRSG